MKKFIFFISIFSLLFAGLQAQENEVVNLDKKYFSVYTGTSTDVLEDSADVFTYVYRVDDNKLYLADLWIDIDTTVGSCSSTWALYGSWDGVTTVSLGTGSTETYSGSVDTLFLLTSGTSTETISQANSYSYLDSISGGNSDTTYTVNGAITKSISLPLKYPYLIVKGTATTDNDSEIQKLWLKLTEYIKPD